MNSELLKQALQLPPAERLKLADEIYRSIDLEIADEGIHPDLLSELERRDAEYEANPSSGFTLEEVEKSLFPPK